MTPTVPHGARTHQASGASTHSVSPASSLPPATIRRLLTHRRCQPEDAGLVRSRCLQNRDVLPRWHQDDRGRASQHRGIHVIAPEGAYSKIPVWQGRGAWLTYTIPVAIATHRERLRSHGVSPDLFKAWALVKSGYADRNGRRCIVRPDVLASVLGCSERHVSRCNAAARAMGVEAVAMLGRMLNVNECLTARRTGSRQRGLSTEVALTTPLSLLALVSCVTPTRGRARKRNSHVKTHSPHKGTKAATPSRRPDKQAWTAARHLAADLIRLLPWLRGESVRRLAPMLRRFVLGWTAGDMLRALEARNRRLGRTWPNPQRIRTRPAAILATMIREMDPDGDHPRYDLPVTFIEPCRRPDCDGHGWINTTNPTTDYALVLRCPDCPPSARGQWSEFVAGPLAEPPF